MILLSVCSWIHCRLLRILAPAGSDPESIGLLDGHLVVYALHAVNVFHKFGDQILLGRVFGLATQRDRSIVRLDLGVEGAG